MAIKDWPAAERPREKLLAQGAAALSDGELLAIFLRTGMVGRDALEIARDLLGRFGGEEFVVLMTDTPLESAQRVAENLRQAIERICIRKTATGETMRTITVSCGVALLQSDDAPIDLVDRADGALYLAKEAGRNRVVVAAARPVARVGAKPAPQLAPQSAAGAR